MLRIEKEADPCVTRLLLSGRIQAEGLDCIKSALKGGCALKVLDLREVTLVDLSTVRFLSRCEEEGIELIECPPYVRQWILRERAEGGDR